MWITKRSGEEERGFEKKKGEAKTREKTLVFFKVTKKKVKTKTSR